MYLGYQQGKIKFYTEQPLDKTLYNLDEIIETQAEYVLDGKEYVLKDEAWEEKQAKKEKERIAKLYLTGADVERGIYKAKGMDFEDILAMVDTLVFAEAPQVANIDIKALKIELKANHFYRGNPYVDAVGGLLGFEVMNEVMKTVKDLEVKILSQNFDNLCTMTVAIRQAKQPMFEKRLENAENIKLNFLEYR